MQALLQLLFGPNIPKRQKAGIWLVGLVFGSTILFYGWHYALGWQWWQYAVAGLISFDISAGASANNLAKVKQHWQKLRRSRRSGQRLLASKLFFGLLHCAYIWAMGFSFWNNPLRFSIVMSVLLLGAILFVSHLPRDTARAGAISMVALSMLVNISFHPPMALWWFIPLLFVKLVSGFSTPVNT